MIDRNWPSILRLGLSVLLVALFATPPATATFVGDLVFCDVNRNGVFDFGDFGLNGIVVRLQCVNPANQTTCFDDTTTTGTLYPTAVENLEYFAPFCGGSATVDFSLPGADLNGRYLFEISGPCYGQSLECSVTVDTSTLPAMCNGLVTPQVGGFPADGNGDGDLCDPEDGPFPEGQPLGNSPAYGGCDANPDPFPADNSFGAFIDSGDDECNVQYDFGYTRETNEATRTPGFWKNHPDATSSLLPIEFCGETIEDFCQAYSLLDLGGGGLNKFSRHAVAGLLNCAAFGCPDSISALIAAGSAACAAGETFDWETAGTTLDLYNNSGEEVEPADFEPGAADPKFCNES